MDTERMKRVLERVYGPAAPAKEKEAPDALRESLRWETEAAVLLRYLVRTSRACMHSIPSKSGLQSAGITSRNPCFLANSAVGHSVNS